MVPLTNTLLLMFVPAILVQTAVLVYSRSNRTTRGSGALSFVMATTLAWTIGALGEALGTRLDWKVVWRNVTQIGINFFPVALLNFSLLYTSVGEARRRRIASAVSLVAVVTILLILTDEWHHLMRSEVALVRSGDAVTLRVVPTLFSTILIAHFPVTSAVSLCILGFAVPPAPPIVRRQLVLAIVGFAIPIAYAISKTAVNRGVMLFIPTPVAFIPMGIALVVAIFRYRMAAISPIARNRVFDIIEEGIVVCDHEGHPIDVNRAAGKIFGQWTAGERLRAADSPSAPGRLTADAIARFSSEWSERIESRKHSPATAAVTARNELGESVRTHQISIYPLTDRAGRFVGTISVLRDVTGEVEYEQYLKAQAEMDLMTGVLNRSTFIEHSRALLRSRGEQRMGSALLILDIDRFKAINDLLGHSEGDRIIISFAAKLRSLVKESDLIGRIGGDEFAVLVCAEDRKIVTSIAERIRNAVEETMEDRLTGAVLQCSVSVGCALLPAADALSPEAYAVLYGRADEALYRAKDSGRNAVSW